MCLFRPGEHATTCGFPSFFVFANSDFFSIFHLQVEAEEAKVGVEEEGVATEVFCVWVYSVPEALTCVTSSFLFFILCLCPADI